MKKHIFLVLFLLLSVTLFAAEQTWENVSVIDGMCLSKVKDNPDKHQTNCLIKCSDMGFGVLTSDGTYLKFDDSGNKKTLDLLEKTDKKDTIRADVTGEKNGDTIAVTSITLK
jgi:hypothetical protein